MLHNKIFRGKRTKIKQNQRGQGTVKEGQGTVGEVEAGRGCKKICLGHHTLFYLVLIETR